MTKTQRQQIKQARQDARAMRQRLDRLLEVPTFKRPGQRAEVEALADNLRLIEQVALGRLAGIAEA